MERVKDTSRLLADDIVRYVTISPTPPLTSPHSATLRRVVDMVSSRHQAVFESIISKVGVREENKQTDLVMCRTTFDKVAHELFADSHYNWGRVVMLYAFAAWLAKHPSGRQEKDGNDEVAQLISSAAGDFVSGELSTWIAHQGGWDAMDAFFPEYHPFESALWRGLLVTLFALGTMAVVASMTR